MWGGAKCQLAFKCVVKVEIYPTMEKNKQKEMFPQRQINVAAHGINSKHSCAY